MMNDFERIFSNAPWESKVGYCRAVKAGNQVFVTSTASRARRFIEVEADAMILEGEDNG